VAKGGMLWRMTSVDIDAYLAALTEPKRSTLEQLRQRIRAVIPEAEESMSYGLPAFKIDGKVVAGFAAFSNHLSYLPHSGSVLSALAAELVSTTTRRRGPCTSRSMNPSRQP
jgi:uncharacterized protein YdhG (YjbR/CyaY superfamily)